MLARTNSPSFQRWLTSFCFVLIGAQTSFHAYAAELTTTPPSTPSGAATPVAAPKPDAAWSSPTASGTVTPKATANSGAVTHATASDTVTPAASKAEVKSRAEQAFRYGLALMRTNECPKALELFNESHRLDPSAASLINVAICHERLGKTAAAWRTFVQAIDAAVSEGSTELRGQAAAALSKLGPILTRVRIVIASPTDDQRISVNGEPVSDYRDPIPVGPGSSVIEV